MKHKKRVLYLGGANSGKSKLAEGFVQGMRCPKLYLATAQVFDSEMERKIAAHRQQRGAGWKLVEAPHDIAPILQGADADSVILVDCITMFISNLMLRGDDLGAAWAGVAAAIDDCPAHLVFVSNEVGHSVVPDNKMARAFTAVQGQWNQNLTALCSDVVFVIAGLPQVLKSAADD